MRMAGSLNFSLNTTDTNACYEPVTDCRGVCGVFSRELVRERTLRAGCSALTSSTLIAGRHNKHKNICFLRDEALKFPDPAECPGIPKQERSKLLLDFTGQSQENVEIFFVSQESSERFPGFSKGINFILVAPSLFGSSVGTCSGLNFIYG